MLFIVIIQTILSKKKIIMKIIGIVLTISLYGFFYYIVLVFSALMEIDDANSWAFVYFNACLSDIFILQSVLAIVKSWLIFILLKKKEKNKVNCCNIIFAKFMNIFVLNKSLQKEFGL